MPDANGRFTPEEIAQMTPDERKLYEQGLAAEQNNFGRVLQNTDDAIKGRESDPLGKNYANGVPTQVAGTDRFDSIFRAGAAAPARANPYSAIVANQARPAQEALYAQMLAQRAGPSLAGMQGARAQGQNLTAALGSGDGRALMNRAAAVGGGIASDTAAGTLAEQLRANAGIGGMASGVRASDLGVAQQQSQAGLEQRGLDDALRQFYAGQGARLANANADLINQRNILLAKGRVAKEEDRANKTDQGIQTGATVLGAMFGL